jgi:sugar O-acyltransferase (sialic acid O-acetyltransferase NeuD family)
MSKLILFGEGDYAEQAYYYFTTDSEHEIVAFTADEAYISKKKLFGLNVVPFEQIEVQYPPDDYKMFIAIGYHNLNKLRASKYWAAKAKGYKLVSYISSKVCNYGGVEFGDNCFILDNAVIQPCSEIGNNVYIWSGNHIGHHSSVGDHCYIAGQVVISGNAAVGEYCFVGVNATISHEITVGRECLIGASTLITKNAPDKSVYIVPDTPKYRLDSELFMKFTKL